ncbi:Ion transport protein-domain-containing protein [Entophlyctis helioformis]|nr:Ion transport protein-domain-containing protein [Entophlyctis helioformis]
MALGREYHSEFSRRSDGNASFASVDASSNFSYIRELGNAGPLRNKVFDITNHGMFNLGIMACVTVNSIIIGLEATEPLHKRYGYFFFIADAMFLGVFIAEMAIKLFALRFAYFRSGWNIFDFIIISVSVLLWILPEVLTSAVLMIDARVLRLIRMFRAVRAIRSLRALRGITFLRSLQVILATLFQSLPAMSSIAIVALLVGYIFAVAGTLMYGMLDSRFNGLGTTSFRLLQVMTLARWSELYTDNKDESPTMWYFLVIFIILQTFVFLNLLVAVIVNNLQSSREHIEIKNRRRKKKHQAVGNMMASVDDLNDSKIGGSEPNLTSQANKQKIDNLVTEEFGLDNYYSPLLPWRTKELLSSFFMHIAALEHNMSLYDRQQKVLEDLVNLAKSKDGL